MTRMGWGHSRVFPGLRPPVAALLAGDTAKVLEALTGRETGDTGSVQLRRHPPECTDEANRCSLGYEAPKRLQKALYVGFSQVGQPLASVNWPVPVSNPRSAPRRAGRTNLRSDAC